MFTISPHTQGPTTNTPRYPFSNLPKPWQEEIRDLQAQAITAKAEAQEARKLSASAGELKQKYLSQRQQAANLRCELKKLKTELAGKEVELTRARQSEAKALDRVTELTMRLSEAQLGGRV